MRQLKVDNPVRAARKGLGLSAMEFAVTAGMSSSYYYALELGFPKVVPERVLLAFEDFGLDGDVIAQEYCTHRELAARKAARVAALTHRVPQAAPVE